MDLNADELDELRGLVSGSDTPSPVATRARIVLWWAERRPKKEIAALAGVSRPTVDLWLSRYEEEGVSGLLDRPRRRATADAAGDSGPDSRGEQDQSTLRDWPVALV